MRNLPVKKNFKRAGALSTLGVVRTARPPWFEQLRQVAEKTDGTFHVFDHFNRGDQPEFPLSQDSGKVSLVQIDLDKGYIGFVLLAFNLGSPHISNQVAKSYRQRAAPGSQIDRGTRVGGIAT
jgi:hypothetical protein